MVSFSDFLKNENVFKPDVESVLHESKLISEEAYDVSLDVYHALRKKLKYIPITTPSRDKNTNSRMRIDFKLGTADKKLNHLPEIEVFMSSDGELIAFQIKGKIFLDGSDDDGVSKLLSEFSKEKEFISKEFKKYYKALKD